MASNSTSQTPESPEIKPFSQVSFKSKGQLVQVILPNQTVKPGENSWSEVWLQLKQRLNSSEHFWQPGTEVELIAKNQLLDSRQLQTISDSLAEVNLKLNRVQTSRRQTAVAAAAAGYCVEQQNAVASLTSDQPQPEPEWAEPLYQQATIRSGIEVRHPGTIIIFGDVNPGGAIIAGGDIFIWGRLRGIAHAGYQGNRECRIMALQMQPTQLRIADAVARAPAKTPTKFEPEIAYVTNTGIRLTKAIDFLKSHSFSGTALGWQKFSGNDETN